MALKLGKTYEFLHGVVEDASGYVLFTVVSEEPGYAISLLILVCEGSWATYALHPGKVIRVSPGSDVDRRSVEVGSDPSALVR